jgi:hypothetical protein
LAFVTKSPSAFLVIAIPVIAAIGLRPWGAMFAARTWIRDIAIWAVVAGGAAIAVWPALATQPLETIGRMVSFTMAEGGQPHAPGNFFLGQPVAVPGPLFYPVALLYRLTPVSLLGLVCLVLASWWQVGILRAARPVWVLIGLAIAFTVFMNLGAKKLDRYILPVVPLLDILAACGLWAATRELLARVRGSARPARLAAPLLAVILLLQPVAWYSVLPYPLAYYDTLMGGGAAAQRAVLVGWGEGLDQAAAYLNAQPDASTATVGVYYPLTVNFQALLRGTAVSFGPNVTPTYVVDYINARQRGQVPSRLIGRDPEYVVQINGIDYARVYRW